MSKQCLIHFGKILTKQISFFGGGRGWSFFFVTFGVCHVFSVKTQGFEWRRLRTKWKHHLHNGHWPKIPYSLISGTVFSTAAPAQLSCCQCSLASQTNHRQRNSSAELVKWKLGITRLSCTFSPTKHSTHHMTNCIKLQHAGTSEVMRSAAWLVFSLLILKISQTNHGLLRMNQWNHIFGTPKNEVLKILGGFKGLTSAKSAKSARCRKPGWSTELKPSVGLKLLRREIRRFFRPMAALVKH